MKRALFIFPILFASFLGAETHNGWKEYGLKEVLGRLKFYAFAKIAQSVRTGAHFDQEFALKEIPCEDGFPKLEGNFQCGLLRASTLEDHSIGSDPKSSQGQSNSSNVTAASSNIPSSQKQNITEGNVSKENPSLPGPQSRSVNQAPEAAPSQASVTPKKIPIQVKWYDGSTLAGKGVLLVPGQNGEGDLQLYYHTDGRLSHYSYGDLIVVFDWKGRELSTILSVKVDSRLRPLSGREYFFP
ncbi:LIC_11883 family protein [Leptospira semungkisensis]|uniref:LIC_11883 family protein n=1 Tax=Leptospira semungkisensis TaxID=2484985 RepID=UPI001FE741F8|nr:hypothetical protein [Leptospira semungkisensis]